MRGLVSPYSQSNKCRLPGPMVKAPAYEEQSSRRHPRARAVNRVHGKLRLAGDSRFESWGGRQSFAPDARNNSIPPVGCERFFLFSSALAPNVTVKKPRGD
ncbi:hypothetical protein PCASD_11523 [Puccinia coronata f. sp. avenae]|uniref:Uncharacterized protein n=1 Tax=Puccinia coronata f. sp. avenae TaxID=200324 RepID=A0A2N5ULU3_9BASI|nr:hypothetical protein PCASD_11523 [Puccinia coronata f. sp. avenae]